MAIFSGARRVASLDDLKQAGDYTGPAPVIYGEEERQMVRFLLPVHKGKNWGDHSLQGSGVHMVTSPPWVFRECPDGSLEIRESIGCGGKDGQPYYWHGYLDEGNIWRQV